ncbi:MAG: hypothetical protein E3J91_02525 [Hadesarchaea archaeon]|nr:MAG: hypothetical protein E3J91_02525 [Hadesarchaea archaeon]
MRIFYPSKEVEEVTKVERMKCATLFGIFLLSVSLLAINIGTIQAQVETLTPHAPIYIEGDGSFTPTNGVNGGGSGTQLDPYIIENFIIDASSAYGIHIENTTKYFVIRNSLVENGGGSYYGIYLDNVINGKIENNTCENNNEGIYLSYSDNCTIDNNTCENNYHGISLWSSSDNNILDNNTCGNNYYGIHLKSSPNYNTIFHNYLLNNTLNNACDDGTNYWDKNGEGNYWSDWQTSDYPDADNDRVVDEPRPILGGTNQDKYPLVIPDFLVSVSPMSGEAVQGEPASATVSVSPIAGFASTVSMSASGLPSGSTASFSPSSGTLSFTSTLTISTASTTPAGTYSITITGTGGEKTHICTYTLTVTVVPFPWEIVAGIIVVVLVIPAAIFLYRQKFEGE